MSIISIQRIESGQVGIKPGTIKMVSTDSFAVVTAAGYLNGVQAEGIGIGPLDVLEVFYAVNPSTGLGTYDVFLPTFSSGIITLVPDVSGGNVLLPVVSGNIPVFNGISGQIKDSLVSFTDPTKTKVVSLDAAPTINHIAKFTNANGTIGDGGVLGTAAAKAASDNTKATLASLNGAVTVNHIATYVDVAGTIGQDAATAINLGNIQAGDDTVKGQLLAYGGSLNGHIIINPVGNTGNTSITIENAIFGQASVLTIPDPGAATASFVLNKLPNGQTISTSTSDAAPVAPIRALTGSLTETVDLTSGNIVGVRGVANVVGASGGFIYGTQGKIIATGTLSGSIWAPAIFGQLDVSAATINGGQVSALWGDWGTTGAIATDMSGTSGIKFTNTTANVLNSQLDTYGDASFLWNIRGNPGPLAYYLAAGAAAGSAGDAAHCAAQQVLKVQIQGATVYIPVFTQNT